MDKVGRAGRRAEQALALLATLDTVSDGGEISELQHALQTATRAETAGADDGLVLAALLHDVGKVFGDAGHGEMAAALLEPHLRPEIVEVVRHHGAFTARHWDPTLTGENDPRNAFVNRPWFELACRFVDEWDMRSFDPTYASQPLSHFEAMVTARITGP